MKHEILYERMTWPQLREIAADASRPAQERCEAILGLSPGNKDDRKLLFELVTADDAEVADEALRISRAVSRLVVAVAPRDELAHERDGLDDPASLGGVGAEHGQLFRRQLARFVEALVADADLADVVHQRRAHDGVDLVLRQLHAERDHARVGRDTLRVTARIPIRLLEGVREPDDRPDRQTQRRARSG